jgi:hypothetical protein
MITLYKCMHIYHTDRNQKHTDFNKVIFHFDNDNNS